MFVYTCPTIPDLNQRAVALSTESYPTCTTGQGQWVHVDTLPKESFLQQTIPTEDVAALIGAMLLFGAVIFVLSKIGEVLEKD